MLIIKIAFIIHPSNKDSNDSGIDHLSGCGLRAGVAKSEGRIILNHTCPDTGGE
jgi:hypothetical protein